MQGGIDPVFVCCVLVQRCGAAFCGRFMKRPRQRQSALACGASLAPNKPCVLLKTNPVLAAVEGVKGFIPEVQYCIRVAPMHIDVRREVIAPTAQAYIVNADRNKRNSGLIKRQTNTIYSPSDRAEESRMLPTVLTVQMR